MNDFLERLVASSPYALAPSHQQVRSDPVRFFRGAAASFADLADDWGVLRKVVLHGRPMRLEVFANTVSKSNPGDVFQLTAPVGEGKTTFLRQLAVSLATQHPVLWWDQLEEHAPGIIADIAIVTGQTPIVVTELPYGISDSVVASLARLRQIDLPCPLIVAGTPGDMQKVFLPGSQQVRFNSLDAEDAKELVNQLALLLAKSAQSGSGENDRIDLELPNLRRFVADPDRSLFTSSESLLVAMLRATYGEDFRRRLYEEYKSLEDLSVQEAFLWTCYTHAVGQPLPVELVAGERSPAEVESLLRPFDKGAPLSLQRKSGRTFVVTRSPVIAQTILWEAGFLTEDAFGDFLSTLLDRVEPGGPFAEFVRTFIAAYTIWEPLDGRAPPQHRGQIRRAIRRTLHEQADWVRTKREYLQGRNDWQEYLGWSRLLISLLPQNHEPKDGASRFVLEEAIACLDRAALHVPADLEAAVEYLKTKPQLRIARFEKDIETEIAILERWTELIGAEGLEENFYFDLATGAASVARESQDGKWAVVCCIAFEHCLARVRSRERREEVKMLYSHQLRLISIKPWRREVVKEAWQTSLKLGTPNASTGNWLAKLHLKAGDNAEAERVLRQVIQNSCWGEAVLLLADLGKENAELHNIVLDYYEATRENDAWSHPTNGALICHAIGLVYQHRRDRQRQDFWLDRACDRYEIAAAADFARMWPIIGEEHWHNAATLVDKFRPKNQRVRVKRWEQAKARSAMRTSTQTDSAASCETLPPLF